MFTPSGAWDIISRHDIAITLHEKADGHMSAVICFFRLSVKTEYAICWISQSSVTIIIEKSGGKTDGYHGSDKAETFGQTV